MKSKKLSSLIFGNKKSILEIKDREKFLEIYEEYLQKHFINVCNEINLYGEFYYFKDLWIYLYSKYRSDFYRQSTFWHIYDLYFEKLSI